MGRTRGVGPPKLFGRSAPPAGAQQRRCAQLNLCTSVILQKLGDVTVSASVASKALEPQTYPTAGSFVYRREIHWRTLGRSGACRVPTRQSTAARKRGPPGIGHHRSEHRARKEMKRARDAAWWAAPMPLCTALHWRGFTAWFRADDFAWLGLGTSVHSLRELLAALFLPAAQGTHAGRQRAVPSSWPGSLCSE